jgi:hypothetical protein
MNWRALQDDSSVGHYDFLTTCTEAGRMVLPQCKIPIPQANSRSQAIAAAQKFFGWDLKNEP